MAGVKRHVEAAEDRNGKRTKTKQGPATAKKFKATAPVKKAGSKKDFKSGKSDKKVSKKKVEESEDEDEFDIDDLSDSGDDDLDALDDSHEDDVDMEDVSDEIDEEDIEEKKSVKSDKKAGAQDGKPQASNESKSMFASYIVLWS